MINHQNKITSQYKWCIFVFILALGIRLDWHNVPNFSIFTDFWYVFWWYSSTIDQNIYMGPWWIWSGFGVSTGLKSTQIVFIWPKMDDWSTVRWQMYWFMPQLPQKIEIENRGISYFWPHCSHFDLSFCLKFKRLCIKSSNSTDKPVIFTKIIF